MSGNKKSSETSKESFGSLGFSVQALTPQLAEEMGLGKGKVGVVVTDVVPGSPAAEKNLQVGDILRRFGQRPVKGWLNSPRTLRMRKRVAALEF